MGKRTCAVPDTNSAAAIGSAVAKHTEIDVFEGGERDPFDDGGGEDGEEEENEGGQEKDGEGSGRA